MSLETAFEQLLAILAEVGREIELADLRHMLLDASGWDTINSTGQWTRAFLQSSHEPNLEKAIELLTDYTWKGYSFEHMRSHVSRFMRDALAEQARLKGRDPPNETKTLREQTRARTTWDPPSRPFVDFFKTLAWDWREIYEGRGRRERFHEWDHPIRYLHRRLEELTGLPREDFEKAAFRINSQIGLAPFKKTRGPGGRVSGPDRRDLRHLLTAFSRLDEQGTATTLIKELREKFPDELAAIQQLGIHGEGTKASQVSCERRFMELAVEEARKSKLESGRKDATPFVGVVVVKNDEILEKAHRGELGEGEHAEYTVLERKLHDKSVSGATVYCTLEPCTTRRHPKLPCAEWLVYRKVARVVFAMLDPNPDIRGLGEQRLKDAGIDVQRFPKDLADQVEEMNRVFIREQKTKAKEQQAQRAKGGDASAVTQGSMISTHNQSGGQVAHSIVNFGASEARLPPKLILSFDKEKDIADQANTVGLDPRVLSRWIRIRVANPNGRKVAKNCAGHLERIKWLGPSGWEDVSPIGTRPLNWEHLSGKTERDLHAGAEHRLDILHAANNESMLRFSTYPYHFIAKPGTYELTIRVSAEDVDSEIVTLRLQWDGTWDSVRLLH
jgi:pyrimidine deaminase RibD-like protein